MKQSLVFVLVILLLTPLGSVHAAEFVEIGADLAASSLSADGRVVVGRTPRDDDPQAYVWSRETGLRMLGTLPGDRRSAARAVSANGSTVAGESWFFGFESEPFVWTEDGGMVGLGLPPGFERGSAEAVSDDGSTVVGQFVSSCCPVTMQSAYRWTQDDGITELMPPGTIRSYAVDVSADGSVIVGSASDGSASDGFIWNEINGFQGFGPIPPGLPGAFPHVVSADGSVVFGAQHPVGAVAQRAFRWTAQEGIRPIPGSSELRPLWYVLNDVTPDGSILVGSTWAGDDGGTSRASIWDEQHGTRDLRELLISEHGFTDADLPTLPIATGISADAKTIIGSPLLENQGGWIIYLDKPLVTFGLDGDYNNNGTVDAADYVVWRNELGTTYTQADYATWRANFGATPAGATAVASIDQAPEPTSLAFVKLSLLVLITGRRPRYLSCGRAR
jgi:uncharacterized membrane protein